MFGKIAAAQIQNLAGLAEAGAMNQDYARRAAEETLARLNDNDRAEAEAILRDAARNR